MLKIFYIQIRQFIRQYLWNNYSCLHLGNSKFLCSHHSHYAKYDCREAYARRSKMQHIPIDEMLYGRQSWLNDISEEGLTLNYVNWKQLRSVRQQRHFAEIEDLAPRY